MSGRRETRSKKRATKEGGTADLSARYNDPDTYIVMLETKLAYLERECSDLEDKVGTYEDEMLQAALSIQQAKDLIISQQDQISRLKGERKYRPVSDELH